jgi:glycosyltransferase involved in cell wall biosynthesis
MFDLSTSSRSAFCEACGQTGREATASRAPKVSVIIGTYDCEPFVEECVRSVMDQTERNIEIIIVDDSSTDRTLSILKKLQSEDHRVSVHSQPHSGYPGCTRNHGIARANGQYITFLDGDDLYHQSKVERVVCAFEACPEADVVFHDVLRFEARPQDLEAASHLTRLRFMENAKKHLKEAGDGIYLCHKELYRFVSLDSSVPFHTSAIAIRKDALFGEPMWFREDLLMGEDHDLWFRLAKHRRFAFVNHVLSYYRQRASSITGDQVLALIKTIQISKENLERGKDIFSPTDVLLYKAKIADLFLLLGYEHFLNFNLQEARMAYKESLRLDFQIKPILDYLKTFVPVSAIREYRRLAG